MREAKPEWIASLRALTGHEADTIRFNELVGRWEFIMAGPTGQPQSQFWGVYHDPRTGERVAPDEDTGLYAFRELDDDGMREALANLERTYLGNRWDGAGSPRAQALARMRQNRALTRQRRGERAQLWADMMQDRSARLRGAGLFAVPGTVTDTLTSQEGEP